MTFFYIENVSYQIYIFLNPDHRKELLYQQIHDFKGVSEICEADTVVEILVLLL